MIDFKLEMCVYTTLENHDLTAARFPQQLGNIARHGLGTPSSKALPAKASYGEDLQVSGLEDVWVGDSGGIPLGA